MSEDLKILARAIAEQTMSYPYKIWGFGEGIGLRALWQAGEVLHEPSYQHWVFDLMEAWLRREPPLQEADHSAPGYVMLEAQRLSGDPRYLAQAVALAERMRALPHDPSGALFHRPQHPDYHHYLYVDCIEVDAPFFCRLAQITGDESYYHDAARQILSYCALLQDRETSLFYHQYNGLTGQVNGAYWGRGNGWAFLGLLETVRLLPRTHESWGLIHQRFLKLAVALAHCQLPSGEWPTVLDQPDTYAEGSLPAMFYYGFANAVRLKLLSDYYQLLIERAWQALRARLSPDGVLQGVSIATPPGDAEHYNRIETGGLFPWGQGPALLACLERLYREV